MPTSKRDLAFLRRMVSMMFAGFGLLVVGILLEPHPLALLRRNR